MTQPSKREWAPAGLPRRPVLVVNPRSGDGSAARAHVAQQAHERGIEVVVLSPGQDLAALAEHAAASGADALGMAGGDGSLAVVAAVALAHGLPFVCVPVGTRNHFALDLGIDRHDPVGALDAFTAGLERRIDVAEVNGRMFLNNVSLGVYGEAVRQQSYRDAKVRTLLQAVEQVAAPVNEAPQFQVIDDLGGGHARPVLLLVSNNAYATGPPPAGGTRPTLASGRLGAMVVDAAHGRTPPRGRAWSAPHVKVDALGPVNAGVDGEPVVLTPPLEFEIRPAALRVLVSPLHPGVSPSGRLAAWTAPTASTGRPDQPTGPSMADAAARSVAAHRGDTSPWTTALRELGAVDQATYEAVARTPTPSLDEPLRRLSHAASFSRLWLGIAAALAAFGGGRGRAAAAEVVVTIGVTSAAVNLVMKRIAVRERPVIDARDRFSTRDVEVPTSWSFPSGHAASAFASSYIVSRHYPQLAVPLRLLAGAVAYSRVHIGVHYPGDVVVGAVVGSGIAAMVAAASQRRVGRRR